MAQPPVMDSSCVQLTYKQNADHELVVVRRVKKEPGAVTGKSVVVLRSSDVITRNEFVFMPNTIEMAQLKKAERGQFKTNVQISSKMTEIDIKRILVESFPFLEKQRFWCAAAVDNRTRLDFHGERRIWDGRAIKQKIKGNSALYIFTEEDPKAVPEQSTLKRSHDQITSVENEKSGQSSKREAAAENIPKLTTSPTAYPGWEKQARLFSAGSLPEYVSSNPKLGPSPGAMETTAAKGTLLEKGAQLILESTEGQLVQQNVVDRGVHVMGRHKMMSAASHPSTSMSIQEVGNAKDVVTGAVPTSSHSLQKGTTMVSQGEMVVRKIIPTASDHQSMGKPLIHIPNVHFEAKHAGLPVVAHTVPHVAVPSMLTPQMSKLNISKAASVQSQKPVDMEKCAEKIDWGARTEEGGDMSQHVLPVTTLAQKLDKKATAGQQHDAVRSLEQSKQSTDVNTQVRASDRHHDHVVTLASDRESQLSDFTDSGFDSYGQDDISQPKEIYHNVAMTTQKQEKKGNYLGEAEQITSGIVKEGGGLQVLSAVAAKVPSLPIKPAVTQAKATVADEKSLVKEIEICPKTSSVRGGCIFMLVFNEHLPADVVRGHAFFGNLRPVAIKKVNEFNMVGNVPAADSPGCVTVKVNSSDGSYLGETQFHYEDEVEDLLQLLVHDHRLQARYFRLLAQALGNKTSETEKKTTSEPSSFKNTGFDITGSRKNLAQQLLLVSGQLLKEECSWSADFPKAEPSGFGDPRNVVNESDYDSDDEASFTSSSEDDCSYTGNAVKKSDYDSNDEASSTSSSEDVCCYAGGFDHKLKICNKTGEIDNCGLHHELDGETKQCAFQFSKSPVTENMSKQATEEDTYDEEQLNFFSLLKTESVAIKDNIENLSSLLPESEPAACPLDSAVSPLSRKEAETRALVSQGEINEVPERSNISGSMEIFHEQSYVDLDENSVSDKTRRATCVMKNNQGDDTPGADL